MKLFDSHCHLDDKQYNRDLKGVLKRAAAAGVECMLSVGASHKSSSQAVSLAESNPGIFASVGVHPHYARYCGTATLDFLIKLAENAKVKAWGEIGLDFNRMYSPREDQERWFIKQLEAADKIDLPTIFHERDSQGRFLEILKAQTDKTRRGVVHCFSGNTVELEKYLDLGLNIGITGIVTMKQRGETLRSMIPDIPADRLVIETDAPYLTPSPEKNHTRRNEPAFVKSVLLKLAEVRKQDPEELANIIWDNTCRLYNLEP
ncbi:MAG: TatD family hydrolase [Desulfobacterales bacterium]|jgi:TatD DNase family protein